MKGYTLQVADSNDNYDNNERMPGYVVSSQKNQKKPVVNYDVRLLQELKDNCRCPICQETYSSTGHLRPKMLPGCNHSLCESCIDQLCRDAMTVPPCCPLCRTHFKVPVGGASKLLVNVDVLRSLSLIAQFQRLCCRKHPDSTEDLCCLSCLTLLCAKCFVNDHAKHEVTSVETAAKNFRSQLSKLVEEAETSKVHMTRAGVALKVFKDRAKEIQRQVLEEEKSKVQRIEKDTAVLLEQLASRVDPLSRKVEYGQKSIGEVIQQCGAIRDHPRELVRQFSTVQAKLERLSHMTVDIDVDEIERQQLDFIPLSLTDWIPINSVNLVGRLTSSCADDISDHPATMKELQAQLDASKKRESSLLKELQEVKEQQRVVINRFSQQAIQYRQQEAMMVERDSQFCQCIEMLKTKLVQMGHSKRSLADRIEIAAQEKTELERKIAVQEECLTEASRRMSELEMEIEELKDQISRDESKERDMEEQLRTERKWRQSAEDESRERRHVNQDLVTQFGDERQNAQREYEELQDRVTTLLKNAKREARQAVWAAAAARETSIRRQTEEKLTEYADQIHQLTARLEQARLPQEEMPQLQAQSLNAPYAHTSSGPALTTGH